MAWPGESERASERAITVWAVPASLSHILLLLLLVLSLLLLLLELLLLLLLFVPNFVLLCGC